MSHPVSPLSSPQSPSAVPGFFYLYVEISKLSHCLHLQNYWSRLTSLPAIFSWLPISGSSRSALIPKLPLSYLSKCPPGPPMSLSWSPPPLLPSALEQEGPQGRACASAPQRAVCSHPVASQQPPCPQALWHMQFTQGSSQFPV